jgi:glycosyltransferase involved in cell wall biosynthesis
MKVLFLNYEYPPLGGGAANATKYLLQEFVSRTNLSVDLVTTAADNKERTEDLGGGVKIHYININKDRDRLKHQSARDLIMYTYKAYQKSAQLMRGEKYDYIHAFFGVPCGSIAQRLSRRFRVPYIVSLRGADVPGFSDRYDKLYPWLRGHIRSVWRGADRVIANSKTLKELALQTAPQQKIDIIYNGVDTELFTPHTDVARADGTFVILTASRLMRRKGINFIIDAFARLRDQHPERKMKMIIAGGAGDASDELHAQTQNLRLSEHVLFTGEYNGAQDIVPAYQNADAFVMASLNEGMSNNMLEALACGLPVVMSRTGGAEILTDGANALIVDRANSDAIATALERILLDERRAQDMSHAARTLAETLSWAQAANRYEQVYYKQFTENS